MTFTFINHWQHQHIILFGCEWGWDSFELVIFNLGFSLNINIDKNHLPNIMTVKEI